MLKPMPIALYASLLALFLSLTGCYFGAVVLYPDECENETPAIDARDIEHWEEWKKAPPSSVLTKADFTKAWGEPNIITSSSDKADRETWIYERRLWCGVIPAVLVPVPLLLPVCDGYERIDFEGDRAERMHLRRILLFGAMAFEGVFNDPACRWPVSNNSAASGGAKPLVATAAPLSESTGSPAALLPATLSSKTIRLMWDAPTMYNDGTALKTIGGYKIYYGTSPGMYSVTIDVGNTTSYTIADLAPGTYYFVITAYDASGNESSYSNEVWKIK